MQVDLVTIGAIVGGFVAIYAILTILKRRRERNWTHAARGDLLADRKPRPGGR